MKGFHVVKSLIIFGLLTIVGANCSFANPGLMPATLGQSIVSLSAGGAFTKPCLIKETETKATATLYFVECLGLLNIAATFSSLSKLSPSQLASSPTGRVLSGTILIEKNHAIALGDPAQVTQVMLLSNANPSAIQQAASLVNKRNISSIFYLNTPLKVARTAAQTFFEAVNIGLLGYPSKVYRSVVTHLGREGVLAGGNLVLDRAGMNALANNPGLVFGANIVTLPQGIA